MCILFIFNGSGDDDNDYKIIVASNRDELYDRPAQNMAPWVEDPNVIGGRDLEANCDKGTWLAVSSMQKKIGVLLNIPINPKQNAITRGNIVADYVKDNINTEDYVNKIRSYANECNGFIFVTLDFGSPLPIIKSYDNIKDKLNTYIDCFIGFGNSLPTKPLKKVEAGMCRLKNICKKFNKADMKQELVNALIDLLKSKEKYLPDPELEERRPQIYQQLSSIFVKIPQGRYGTRTHTLMLVTKSGHVDLIEITMQAPIDLVTPNWHEAHFQFDI